MMPREDGTGFDGACSNRKGAFLIELGTVGRCGLLHVCCSLCGVWNWLGLKLCLLFYRIAYHHGSG